MPKRKVREMSGKVPRKYAKKLKKNFDGNLKKKLFKKITSTTVQIRRLENIEHKIMKQVSYSGKYSLSAKLINLIYSSLL